MEWYNEPPVWHAEGDAIRVTSGAKTDFWRKTHYGFTRDSGHFYYQPITGNFVLEVKVSGQYAALYDQAGVMLRLDDSNWIKCGIEFVNGTQYVSAVVTRDYSDWSVAPLSQNPPSIWLRITREAEAVEIHYALDGQNYSLLRLAYLIPAPTIQAGVMCAAPDGDGFSVTFEGFTIRSK